MWKIPEESQLIFRGTVNAVDNLDELQDDTTKKDKGSSGASIDVVALLDEDSFISGGDNGSISLWNAGKKKPLYTKMRAHGGVKSGPDSEIEVCKWICSLAVVPFTDLFCSGSGDGYIRMWKLNDNKRSFSALMNIPMVLLSITITELTFICIDWSDQLDEIFTSKPRCRYD